MASRFNTDPGIRGGSPFEATGAAAGERGGYLDSGQEFANVHSSRGFRRALRSTQARSNRLAGRLPSKNDFGNQGFRKPNYFAQGGARHGMHIGAGAPFTGAAGGDSAEGFGGE